MCMCAHTYIMVHVMCRVFVVHASSCVSHVDCMFVLGHPCRMRSSVIKPLLCVVCHKPLLCVVFVFVPLHVIVMLIITFRCSVCA